MVFVPPLTCRLHSLNIKKTLFFHNGQQTTETAFIESFYFNSVFCTTKHANVTEWVQCKFKSFLYVIYPQDPKYLVRFQSSGPERQYI